MEYIEINTSNLLQYDNITAQLKLISYVKNNWKVNRYIWENPSKEELDIKIGDRVFPAGENYKDFFYLKEIKGVGEKFYPDGGYICTTLSGSNRDFYFDSVIKHPNQKNKNEIISKKRKKTKK